MRTPRVAFFCICLLVAVIGHTSGSCNAGEPGPRDSEIPHILVQHITLLDGEPGAVRPATHEEEVLVPTPEGVAVSDDRVSLDVPQQPGLSSLGMGSSAGCWSERPIYADPCGRSQAYGCNSPAYIWVRGEYLLWWTKGMDVPPLVTTSPAGTPGADAGVLGVDGTSVLFGNSSILNGSRSGGRIRIGGWLDDYRRIGLEGDFLALGDESIEYRAASDANGSPILARPFFNMNPRDPATEDLDPPAREDAELVSYPGILAGAVTVHGVTGFHSAGARLRSNLCCNNQCRQDPCSCASTCVGSSRVDFLLGYRYIRLRDSLSVTEDLVSLEEENSSHYDIVDSFETRNCFHGAEIGAIWELRRRRWSLEVLSKIALGNNHQVVDITGSTIITPFEGGPQIPYTGGLLAQRTNIGHYSRNEFAMIPEIGVTLGYALTDHLQFKAGYTLIYWGHVVRPGDQINLDLNPDLLPPEMVPFVGPLRPTFAFHHTDFWAHGLSLGLDYSW